MSARLLFLLAVPCEVFVFARIAPLLNRRFGLPSLVIAGIVLWFASTKTAVLAETLGPAPYREGIGMLVFIAELIGAASLVVIGVRVRRHARLVRDGPDASAVRVPVRSVMGSLAVGIAVTCAVLLAALVFFSLMAP